MNLRSWVAAARLLPSTVAVMLVSFLEPGSGTCMAQVADDGLLAGRKAEAESFFQKRVTPFIKTYCLECHQNRRPTEAGLSFTPALDTPGHAAFSEKWKKSAARVKAHDMPPDGSEQPNDEERQMFMEWLEMVKYLSPPDPGAFVIRRLTKSEYGNTLRDLFGVDPRIVEALPDEVSGEGYLNSISPLQLEQYLAITEEVLDQILPNDALPVRRHQPSASDGQDARRTTDFQSADNHDGQDVRRTTDFQSADNLDGQDVRRTTDFQSADNLDGQDARLTQSADNHDGQDVRRTTDAAEQRNTAGVLIDLSRFFQPPVPEANVHETVRSVAKSLAKRVYRRPASDSELKVLVDVFDLGQQNGLSYQAALRLMLKGMLVSPQFLFITPVEVAHGNAEIVPLDDYHLASRISYLLWATLPDDELMALADAGKLHEPSILEKQVERMLQDARSRALFDGFGAQWLGIGDLTRKTFDPAMFPEMTPEMRLSMFDEVRLFFESIMRENLSIALLIDSEYTFLNETLASIYGLQEAVSGSVFRKVQLSDRNRGGILGMPGVLAATSFPNRTSPVNRGVWVLERLLGEHVPPAPPDVPALEKQDQQSVENLTLRQRFELHRSDSTCANCHRLFDPIGFGLENFDAIGRWREQDETGTPIDASGELPDGIRFANPQELKTAVSDRLDDFSRNLVERMLAYALCRKLEGYDEIVVDSLIRDIARDGYRLQSIVTAVVTSYPFTHRRIN